MSLSGVSGSKAWTPLPQLTIPPVGLAGSVARTKGVTAFDVTVDLAHDWKPADAVTVSGLSARLSNQVAPADCPGWEPGKVWLAVSGAATVGFGSTDLKVGGAACVLPGSGAWSFSSTATLDSWKPIPDVNVAVESVGIRAVSTGDGKPVQFTAFGAVAAYGATFRATVSVQDGSVLVDAAGDVGGGTGAGLPAGTTGHVIYASKARPKYQLANAALTSVDAGYTEVDVPQGVTVYGAFDIPLAVRNLMVAKLKLPSIRTVVMSASLGSSTPVLKASVQLGEPGQGVTIYENCGRQACTTDTRTRLGLTDLTLTLSATGEVGFEAGATLAIAKSNQTPASSLELAARVTIDLKGPKITVALFTRGGVWKGALGVPDLDLSGLGIQAGLDFATAIPTPSVGVSAAIAKMPKAWRDSVGMDENNSEPIRFAINLSITSPIIDIQLGVPDGKTVLDPLRAIAKDQLKIDYASLVVAPFGGTLGNRTYAPGLSFGFAATIAGVPLDAAFAVDPSAPRIEGALKVGDFSVGGVTIKKISAELLIDPKGAGDKFYFHLSGGVELPPLEDGAKGGSASGEVTVRASQGKLQASLEVHAKNIGFAGVAKLDRFDLSGSLDVSTTSAPSVTLKLEAAGELLGAQVTLSGSLKLSEGRLESIAVRASVEATFGTGVLEAKLTGPGCAGMGHGACVSFSYADGKFSVEVAAILQAKGFEIALAAQISSEKIAGSGSLAISGVGTFSLSGALYLAAGKDAAGHQVAKGDFDFAAAVSTAKFNGFEASVSVSVNRRGKDFSAKAAGSVTTPAGSVKGAATFVYEGGTLTYDLRASADITIAGVTLAAADVRLVKTRTSFSATVNGSVSIMYGSYGLSGKLNGTFGAAVTKAGSVSYTYDFTGDISLKVPGLTATASVTFRTGLFAFQVDLGDKTIFNVSLKGTVAAGKQVQASVAVTVVGLAATVTLDNTKGSWQLGAVLSYKGHTLAYASIGFGTFKAGVDFDFDKSGALTFLVLRIGGTLSGTMHASVTITRTPTGTSSLDGSFSGAISAEGWFSIYKVYGWTGSVSTGRLGARVSKAGEACATIRGEELCV